ncbi:glycosyltransferase family 4 protein [Alkalicaulis satelles]|uniref:Glycosyltransferase family 4 protein n=1 Tax=Alkalicaulis satelles TaxID=2609175 RepID=A0A5M6ZC33_9PROT|nr:glycosyltransferase family 4 protein [Alkalicaulis satelles]KAA5802272.1 glycosyltransferase family 4 protein [Alkalicaulis satelles]
MVILQLIPELDAGGAERTTIEMAEAVTRAGGRCLVASCGGRLESALLEAGGELIRLDMKSKNPVTLWRNAARLARLIEAEGVQIVHARSRAPAWSGRWAARRTGAAFVTTYHGTYSARTGLKRVYNAVMASGDRVIANSYFIADHVRAEHGVGEDRLRVIPRGVDLDVFDPAAVAPERVAAMRARWGASPGEAVVLLPGRLTRWKGQAFLIEALAGWPSTIRLVCAGDAQGRGAYEDALKAAAEAAGVTLVLPGHESDMAAAYMAADLVVCPSLEPEAFGRTAAEAMAMGAPVIASDHGGAREVVAEGETGWRAAPGDAEAWRNAIAAALALDSQARAALAGRGRARAAALFSKQALQESTLQVYRELLE